jgi:glycosyltransferase involved in cell wall biosynthesis
LEDSGFEVDYFEGQLKDLNQTAKLYSGVVVWQQLEYLEYISIDTPKIIVPMYDGCANYRAEFFNQIPNAVYISFSKNIHRFLRTLNKKSFYVKYYPPMPKLQQTQKEGAFFWERTPTYGFSFPIVQKIFSELETKIMYRPHHDPHDTHLLPNEDVWTDHEDYLEKISQFQFFVAPRSAEGIGMSFLEAFCRGVIIVAHDGPTMNEYIKHKKNGILVNLNKPPKTLDQCNLNKLSSRAIRDATKGRKKFLNRKEKLAPFIWNFLSGENPKPFELKNKLIPGHLTIYQFYLISNFKISETVIYLRRFWFK